MITIIFIFMFKLHNNFTCNSLHPSTVYMDLSMAHIKKQHSALFELHMFIEGPANRVTQTMSKLPSIEAPALPLGLNRVLCVPHRASESQEGSSQPSPPPPPPWQA